MSVNCEGCAGCCIDWRSIASTEVEENDGRQRRSRSIDDAYPIVMLTQDDVWRFLDVGLGDALTPRLFHAEGPGCEIDGIDLAAIDGLPIFFMGIRKPPKPVAPFGFPPAWLPSCVFLNPETLRCRIHNAQCYPTACSVYPNHHLALGKDPECKRVEATFGGQRLIDGIPPNTHSDRLPAKERVGRKVFVYPEPDELPGIVERIAGNDTRQDDRARFVATAAATFPGSTTIDRARYRDALSRVCDTASWVERVMNEWTDRPSETPPDPAWANTVEKRRGAPSDSARTI